MTEPDLFDPNDHTAAEVLDYLAANPDETDRVLEAEAAGKRRKSILGDSGRVEDSPLVVNPEAEAAALDQARVAEVQYNPDGEWLAPVDAQGRMLVDNTGQPLA